MPATMTPEADAVLETALKLSAAEREAIALRLLDSIDAPNSFDSPEALRAELQRRIEDIESGRVKALSPEEATAAVRKAREERGG
jgi:putative addiction module component (TIGR02574 family)